jgi:hypothetical protein
MTAILFGFTGAVIGHLFMGMFGVKFSMFSIMGLFGLAGIIVNDSIVLVSFFRQLVADGMDRFDAIVEACVRRLRAVLLTSITTVAGLTPILFESSLQAQFLKPMAVSLVFGLSFGTVLILLVVPSMLMIIEETKPKLETLRRQPESGADAAPAAGHCQRHLWQFDPKPVPPRRRAGTGPERQPVVACRAAVLFSPAAASHLLAMLLWASLPGMDIGAVPVSSLHCRVAAGLADRAQTWAPCSANNWPAVQPCAVGQRRTDAARQPAQPLRSGPAGACRQPVATGHERLTAGRGMASSCCAGCAAPGSLFSAEPHHHSSGRGAARRPNPAKQQVWRFHCAAMMLLYSKATEMATGKSGESTPWQKS